jgi:hypothetical protein
VEDSPYQHHLKTAIPVKEQVGLLVAHWPPTYAD